MHITAPFTIAATLLLAVTAKAELYPKSSSVLRVEAKDYDRLVLQSNYTSIVEFYSPNCIHCQNLVPIYEKAAQSLAGLAKVVAVNCQKESNNDLCQRLGIQGFPTLKIVKPSKNVGKPIVEEYSGARSAKAIVETVIDKIPNLVKKPSEKNLDEWIKDAGEKPVAILFTDKYKINPLLKALAIEFKGSITFAHFQISNVEESIAQLYEIKKLPTLMLVKSGEGGERFQHDGKMKKDALVEFLSKVAEPNPDPAPIKTGESTAPLSSQKVEAQKPIVTPNPVVPIVVLDKEDELVTQCLHRKTGTCLLALLPESADKNALALIDALTQLMHKRKLQKRATIPTFVLPEANPKYATIRSELSLSDQADVIAVNGKRAWWKQLLDVDFSCLSAIEGSLETWMSAIQLDEGEKKKLPASLISEKSGAVEDPSMEEVVSQEEELSAEDGPNEELSAEDGPKEELSAEDGSKEETSPEEKNTSDDEEKTKIELKNEKHEEL